MKCQGGGRYQVTKANYFVNDEYVGSAIPPFKFSFTPEDVASIRDGQSANTIRVVVYDSGFNKVAKSAQFLVSI